MLLKSKYCNCGTTFSPSAMAFPPSTPNSFPYKIIHILNQKYTMKGNQSTNNQILLIHYYKLQR